MILRLVASVLGLSLAAGAVVAQQPRGARKALENMTSQPATHSAITFDKDMLQNARGFIDDESSARAVGSISSITVENFRYSEPAFYAPDSMTSLIKAYNSAGWKHLVNQNAGSREDTMPNKQLTDLWLHFRGMEIDDVTVLMRGPRAMSVIEISGALRPLDLVKLSGHFGIPKVDPDAVMVPAAPGK